MLNSLFIPSGPEITLDFRREGLAITAAPPNLPELRATLVLRWTELGLIIGLVIVAGLLVYFRHQLARSWLISTWAPSHLMLSAALVTLFAFLLAVLVTLWKKKQLFTYSITEIVFALFTTFQIVLHLWPQGRLADFVALGSALYVLSRGCGNFWDAFKQEKDIERLKVQLAGLNVSFGKT